MNNISNNNELTHFIETASKDTLLNFLKHVEENQAGNLDLKTDLKRILQEKYDMFLIATQ